MQPRQIFLDPENRAAVSKWSRRALGICGVLIAGLLISPTIQHAAHDPHSAQAQERPREPACARWDDLAGEAIVRLVQSKRDVDLRQVGDVIFRMRRARRNCSMGWVRLACLDYRGIVRVAPGGEGTNPDRNFACGHSPTDEARRRFTAATEAAP